MPKHTTFIIPFHNSILSHLIILQSIFISFHYFIRSDFDGATSRRWHLSKGDFPDCENDAFQKVHSFDGATSPKVQFLKSDLFRISCVLLWKITLSTSNGVNDFDELSKHYACKNILILKTIQKQLEFMYSFTSKP